MGVTFCLSHRGKDTDWERMRTGYWGENLCPMAGSWRRIYNEELCGTHGRNEKCIQNFCRNTWREETTVKT